MSLRERLTEDYYDDMQKIIRHYAKSDNIDLNTGGDDFQDIIDRLAEYEIAEVDGRLAVLPCKIGTLAYNNGWIPVDERLPEDDVDVLVTYADIDDEEYADITITTYGNAYLGGNKLDFKEWRSPFEYFKSNYKVMAWQYLPEPYRPERNNEHDGE